MAGLVFRLFLALSESLNLVLLYLYAISGFETTGFVRPWSFATIAVSVVVVNLALSRASFRYFTIAVANVAVFSLFVRMAFAPGPVFTVPTDPARLMGYIATGVLVVFAGSRAAWFAWKKEINRYSHFDLNIAALFVILLLSAIFGVTIPGAQAVVFVSIASNILMLFFGTRSEGSGLVSRRALFALAALLVPVWLVGNSEVLSALSHPADSVVDFTAPFFEMLLEAFKAVILFIFVFLRLVPRRQAPTESVGEAPVAAEEVGPAEGTGILATVLFWTAAAAGIVLLTLLVLYIVWLLVSFLLKNRTASPEGWTRPSFRSFLSALVRMIRKWAQVAAIVLPLPITPERAWGFLLFWGKHKGRARHADETAYEYLARLLEKFPDREKELSRITGSFVRHRYSREGKVFERGLKLYVWRLYFSLPRLGRSG